MSSPRAYHEIKQFGKTVVDARNNDGKNKHDDKHYARCFERFAERGPGDTLKLRERLLDLASLSDKPIGLFVLVLLGILAGNVVLLLGALGLLHVFFFLCHDIFPCLCGIGLLGFFVHRVLLARRAVFLQLETVRIVALVFEAVIITVLALRALERDLHSRGFGSHGSKTPYKKITPLSVRKDSLTQSPHTVNRF